MTSTPPGTGTPAGLPALAGDTTAEQPWPVRVLSMKIAQYVDRMSPLWVEGQIVQLNVRARTAYLTLRDADVDMSLSLTVPTNTLNAMGPAVREGARVVVHAKPTFWTKRGSLMMEGRTMRPVGEGELLLRLEQLKHTLAAEGLFAPDRKRPLPFLPRVIGLITGREGAAENDVVENARRRWPAAHFEIRHVPVQGPDCVTAVSGALRELDGLDHVDVIVIARGGGSFEDLLGFSNETLVRAVSAARTPVVSAIGHDVDTPLLDHVADRRASTPTDAAKLVVPDLAAEQAALAQHRTRLSQGLRGRFAAERRHLNSLVGRPVLREPGTLVTQQRDEVDRLTNRSAYAMRQRLTRARDQIAHGRAQVIALSPQKTLDRGYAVVQHADGSLVMARDDVSVDDILKVTVSQGNFAVTPYSGKPRTRRAGTPTTTKARTAASSKKATQGRASDAPKAKKKTAPATAGDDAAPTTTRSETTEDDA